MYYGRDVSCSIVCACVLYDVKIRRGTSTSHARTHTRTRAHWPAAPRQSSGVSQTPHPTRLVRRQGLPVCVVCSLRVVPARGPWRNKPRRLKPENHKP